MKNVLILVFCILSLGAFAQTSTVTGAILDDSTKQAVSGAKISLVGTDFSTTTDASGNFTLVNVPYGKYSLQIQEGENPAGVLEIQVNAAETALGGLALQFSKLEQTQSEDEDDKSNVQNNQSSTESEDVTEVGGQTVSSSLASVRDLFVSTSAFVFSEGRFSIRGYKPEDFHTYMNGVPVNDMERGSIPYGSWGGLSDVVRNRTFTVGLRASEFAFGGVGGSFGFDIRASAEKKGLSVSYSNGNRNYRHRLMATYSTGLLKGGWAIAASFSKRWATEGYVPGTFYDGYSYYFSVDKHFGSRHTLSLSTYGSPTRDGRAIATVQEAYNLAGSNYYNPGWGYQNGVKRNAYVNKAFEPQFILSHEWKIDDKSTLRTAASFQFGKRSQGDMNWGDAADPRPDYYQNLPSYIQDTVSRAYAEQQFRNDINLRQINFDKIYNENRNNIETVANANGVQGNNQTISRSLYILENRVQDQKRFNFNTVYNTEFTNHVALTAGLTYRFQESENFRQVSDLLGGTAWLDVDKYAVLQYPDSASAAQSNINQPNRLVGVGDKYGYDYRTVIHNGSVWAQPQFHFRKIDFFAAGQFSVTAYWRNGLFKNGLFPTSSYGKSEVQNFYNYSVKAGLIYKPDNNNYLYLNAGYYTQAPYINDVFVSARTRDQVVDNVKNEKDYSAELGYQYNTKTLKVRAAMFYTQFTDQTKTISFYDDDQRTFVNYSLTGMNTRHWGGEAAVEWRFYKGFSASAVASMGRYTYTSRPLATITQDNSSAILAKDETVYLKNFNVTGSPQLATSFGLSYHSPQFWFVNLYFNYYDWMWVSVNPARRTVEAVSPLEYQSQPWYDVVDQQRLKGQFMMDMFAGYTWFMNKDIKGMKKKCYMSFTLNVSNLTNNRNFATNAYEQSRFDFLRENAAKFPPKFAYAYGTTYMLTVAFKMN